MTPLPLSTVESCWNRIGSQGDRSCSELQEHTHCNHCPTYAAAGHCLLDVSAPPNYGDEWVAQLAAPEEEETGEQLGVLVFRIAEEWLALPVEVLVEVTHPRPVRRVPRRGGMLAGLVNIRGELHLCVHFDRLLGIERPIPEEDMTRKTRMVVIRRGTEGWAFSADETDQVRRVPCHDVILPPPTLSRAAVRLTRGVFPSGERNVGLLDSDRVFETIRERLR